jgi:hypothetical protein
MLGIGWQAHYIEALGRARSRSTDERSCPNPDTIGRLLRALRQARNEKVRAVAKGHMPGVALSVEAKGLKITA